MGPLFLQDLIRDLLTQQTKNAETLGRIESGLLELRTANVDTAKKIAAMDAAIELLKGKDWRRVGFIAGVMVVADPLIHFLITKMGAALWR